MEINNYEIGGFYFGNAGVFNLTIKAKKPNGNGYGIELAVELTPAERQELITMLLTIPQEKN
jgi:hypothetical protein